MSAATREITQMLEMLPSNEQEFACELMRKLVKAWDSDFTKLTPKEASDLQLAREQVKNGEVFSASEIDGENLDKMDLD